MISINRICILIITLCLCGCNSNQNSVNNKSAKNIIVTSIDLEKLTLELPEKYYFAKGFIEILDDTFHFFDTYHLKVHLFDKQLTYDSSILGPGDGPQEILGLNGFSKTNENKVLFDQSKIIFYVYDSNWNYIKKTRGNLNKNGYAYEFGRHYDRFPMVLLPKSVIVPMDRYRSREDNPYSSNEFYVHSCLMVEYDLNTGSIIREIGKKSPVFQNYSYIPHHLWIDMTADNDFLYVIQEPDSLIEVYDLKSYELVRKFGLSGQDMTRNYIETKDVEESDALLVPSRIRNGYYKSIKAIPEKDLIFRIYTLGTKDERDMEVKDNPKRMQIYKNEVLIGDVEVPTELRIIGYIEPYFYAQGEIEESSTEKNEVYLYKFKLPE